MKQFKLTKGKRHNQKKLLLAPLPSHLPRLEKTIEPQNLTADTKKIREEITEILEYTPGKLFVRKIIRPKYKIE